MRKMKCSPLRRRQNAGPAVKFHRGIHDKPIALDEQLVEIGQLILKKGVSRTNETKDKETKL